MSSTHPIQDGVDVYDVEMLQTPSSCPIQDGLNVDVVEALQILGYVVKVIPVGSADGADARQSKEQLALE